MKGYMNIKKLNLNGFRNPSEEEKQKITNYYERKLKSEKRMINIFTNIFIVIGAILCINIFTENQFSMFYLVLGLLIVFACYMVKRSNKKRNKKTMELIKRGCNVIECICIEAKIESSYDGNGGHNEWGVAKIKTLDGQECNEMFPVDKFTVNNKKAVNSKMLLAEFEDGSYRLFTEAMLNGQTND